MQPVTASHSSRLGALTPLFGVVPQNGSEPFTDIEVLAAILHQVPVEPAPVASSSPYVGSFQTARAANEGATTPDLDTIAAPVGEPVDLDSTLDTTPETPAAPATPHDTTPVVAASSAPAIPLSADGLPLSLDVFAVATRCVMVLIGADNPARQIAKTAIGLSIESEHCAALDVVIPRAIDLVLHRANQLVSLGVAHDVVDDYEHRLQLWQRLASRSGLEPAAVVLSLAPFPPEMIASMLRVSLAEVIVVLERWAAGIDPEDEQRVPEVDTEAVAALIEHEPEPPILDADSADEVDSDTIESGSDVAAQYSAHSASTATPINDEVAPGSTEQQHTEMMAMNEDALGEFLGLPDGRGSRLRQFVRRFRG